MTHEKCRVLCWAPAKHSRSVSCDSFQLDSILTSSLKSDPEALRLLGSPKVKGRGWPRPRQQE